MWCRVDHQDVAFGGEPDQGAAPDRPGDQVEGLASSCASSSASRVARSSAGRSARSWRASATRRRLIHHEFGVDRIGDVAGAQDLVAGGQRRQGLGQRDRVERAVQLEVERHVVGRRVRMQLLEEKSRRWPGERIRCSLVSTRRAKPAAGSSLFRVLPRDARPGPRAGRPGPRSRGSRRGPHRQLGRESLADAHDQPGSEQRMAAQLEEAFVGADLRRPQEVAEDLVQLPFERGARRPARILAVERQRGWAAAASCGRPCRSG